MYIMIHESGDMILLNEYTAGDIQAADNGLITLIDISVTDKPLQYFDESWIAIDVSNTK